HNNGTVTVGDNCCGGNFTWNMNGTTDNFYNLTLNHSYIMQISAGDTLTVKRQLNLTNGNLGGTGKILVNVDDAEFAGNSGVTIGAGYDGGTGNIEITGTGAYTFDVANGAKLPNLTLNAANVTISAPSLNAATTTINSINLDAGTINLSNIPTTVTTTVDIDGGNFTTGDAAVTFTGAVTLDNSAVFTTGSGTVTMNSTFTQGGASSATFSGGSGEIYMASDFTLTNGTFTSTTGNLKLNWNFTEGASGNFVHNNGTVTVGDNCCGGNFTWNMNGTTDNFYNLTLNHSYIMQISAGDNPTVTNTLTLTNGSFQGSIYAGGNIFQGSGYDGSGGTGGTLTVNGTGDQIFSGNANSTTGKLPAIVINKASGTLTLGDGSNNTLRADNGWTYTAGTVDTSTYDTTVHLIGAKNLSGVFDNVNFPSGTMTLTGNLDVNGNLTIAGGTLDASSYTINVAGNWTRSSGAFTKSTSTVIFDGTDQTLNSAHTGANSFNNLTITRASGTPTFSFQNGVEQEVTGTLTITGAGAASLLNLRSTSDGSQWNIDAQGTRSINYLNVKDSNNVHATAMACGACVDASPGATNTNWTFPAAAAQPSITAPPANSFNQSTNPTLTSSTLSPADSGHLSSDWKITTDSDGNNVVWSKTGDTTNLTSIVVNTTNGTFAGALAGQTELAAGTTYYAFAKHTNVTGASSFSAAQTFKTTDTAISTTQTWSFNDDVSNYTYDNTKIEVNAGANSLARLKDLGGGTYTASGGPAGTTKRKSVTVTEQSGSTLTNHQVKITVAYDADMQADFDDIRFTDSDGSTLLDHWLESKTDSDTADFWVEIPTLTASQARTIYVYYGNSDSSSASNGPNTFPFIDDFNDNSFNTSLWTDSATTAATETGGKLNITNGSVYTDATVVNTPQNYIFETKVNFSSLSPQYSGGIMISDAQSIAGSNANSNALAMILTEPATPRVTYWGANGSAASYNLASNLAGGSANTGTDYVLGYEFRSSSNISYFIKNSSYVDIDRNNVNGTWNVPAYLFLGYFQGTLSDNADAADAAYDWVRVRKYAATQPSVGAAGAEQNVGDYDTVKILPAAAGSHPNYAQLGTFTETLGGGNAGSVSYQVSNNGTDWYYHDGANWSAVTTDETDNNTAAEVNNYLPQFATDIGAGDFYFKAFLISDGAQQVELDSIAITYLPQAMVTLTATPTTISENGGTATITATLSKSIASDVTVTLTPSGTATNDTDYSLSSTSITITAGNTTGSVTLTGSDDTIDEDSETVILDITSVTNGQEDGVQQVTVNLTDDDDPPELSINNVAILEGSSGTQNANFTVTLAAASSRTITVDYATRDGSAFTSNNDYTNTSGTLTISAGSTSGSITVPIVSDTTHETDENFYLTLSNPTNATLNGVIEGIGTITNDDGVASADSSPPPGPQIKSISSSVNTLYERDGKRIATGGLQALIPWHKKFIAKAQAAADEPITGNAIITVTLTEEPTQEVKYGISISGSAEKGFDFTLSTSQITFAAGETEQTFTVTIIDDEKNEFDETATFTVGGVAKSSLTLIDDDPEPLITIEDITAPEGNSGTANVLIPVKLSATSGKTVRATITSSNGTATAGIDYSPVDTVVEFAGGEREKNIAVAIRGDTLMEENETVTFTLSDIENAQAKAEPAILTIENDDALPTAILLEPEQSELQEDENIDIVVELSEISSLQTEFTLTTYGTALTDVDFHLESNTIKIPAGELRGSTKLLIHNDDIQEAAEDIIIEISESTNAKVGAQYQQTVTILANAGIVENRPPSSQDTPDLEMITVTTRPLRAVTAGTEIIMRAYQQNNGPGVSENTYSTVTIRNTEGIVVATITDNNGIWPPSIPDTATFRWTPSKSGVYTYEFCVDRIGAFQENNPENNCITYPHPNVYSNPRHAPKAVTVVEEQSQNEKKPKEDRKDEDLSSPIEPKEAIEPPDFAPPSELKSPTGVPRTVRNAADLKQAENTLSVDLESLTEEEIIRSVFLDERPFSLDNTTPLPNEEEQKIIETVKTKAVQRVTEEITREQVRRQELDTVNRELETFIDAPTITTETPVQKRLRDVNNNGIFDGLESDLNQDPTQPDQLDVAFEGDLEVLKTRLITYEVMTRDESEEYITEIKERVRTKRRIKMIRTIATQRYGLKISTNTQDSNNDGISDEVAVTLGLDPVSVGQENEPLTPGEKIIYGQFERVDARTPCTMNLGYGEQLSVNGFTVLGACIYNGPYTLFLIDAAGNAKSFGTKIAENNKLVFTVPKGAIDAGFYLAQIRRAPAHIGTTATLIAQQPTLSSAATLIELIPDNTLKIKEPIARSIGVSGQSLIELTPSQVKNIIVSIDEATGRVKVAGEADIDATVIGTFESAVYSAALFANTENGYFEVVSPQPLERGKHQVVLYAKRPLQNSQSVPTVLEFELKKGQTNLLRSSAEQGEETSENSNLIYIVIGIGIISVAILFGIGLSRKKPVQ
ncbi:hypothetical protein COV82_01435, partial [Candidatus Peregrinibacteria bacterium CG11_big_fil_rev_8_21_14_0_20_46_8]